MEFGDTPLHNTINMIDDLILLHGRHTPRCIASVDKRFDYYTLQLMTSGGVNLSYGEGDTVEMRGAWTWPCFPGPSIRFHEWPRGAAWEHRYVAFKGPRVAHWESSGVWLDHPEPVADAGRLRRVVEWFDELLLEKERPGPWGQRTAANLLERILLFLAEDRMASRSAAAPDWLDEVLVQLARFDQRRPEPDYLRLADHYGISLVTLRRQFRAYTGTSLHDYRLGCRISAARSMLGDPRLPIKEIARRLGYSDVFYFTRQFAEKAGASPGSYRRSVQPSGAMASQPTRGRRR